MKTPKTSRFIRGITAGLGGFVLFTQAVSAAPFLYSPGDLVLAFRQTGSASDYAVNIGKATNYNNLPSGTTFTVTNLSASQLNSAFPSVNELKWSVAAAIRSAGNTNYPIQTLWVSRARTESSTQSARWLRRSTSTQGTAGAQIDAVGVRAANGSSFLSAGPNNTATGVVLPVASDFNLGQVIGTFGNYDNTFQGNVENLTAEDFDGDPANVSRSDLYELLPGNSALNLPGRYLGYFELKPNGTLTFTAASSLPPAPTITTISRNGSITTVSFTTVAGATYRLRAVDAAGFLAPVSTWTVGNSITGTGEVLSLTDTSSADTRFFAVDAQ